MQPRINLVKFIANFAPWLAPLPSAYFVTRSSIQHLGIPLVVGVVVGLVVETLGFSTVHLYLMLLQWNLEKRKNDPEAPANLAFILVIFYLFITITLTVVLEIIPSLSVFAPVLFPLLALSGAFVLALLTQQEQRLISVQNAKLERSAKCNFRQNTGQEKVSILTNTYNSLAIANDVRKHNKNTFLERLEMAINEHPEMGVTELKNLLGVHSRSTIYSYIKELEALGRIKKIQASNS